MGSNGLPCAALAIALALGAEDIRAQTAVCFKAPGSDERIGCTEGDTPTDDIDLHASGGVGEAL